MAQKAYISLDANAQEMLAFQQLYKAVPLGMQCRIMDKVCRSITEAADVVGRYEGLLNDCPDKKRTVARGADRRPVYGNNQNIGSAENQPHYNKNSDHGSSYGDYLHNNGFRGNNQSADSTLSQNGGPNYADNETVSISTALRDLVERIDRLERGRNQPAQSKQLRPRQNKTCYICSSPYHFFFENVLNIEQFRQVLTPRRKWTVGKRETVTSVGRNVTGKTNQRSNMDSLKGTNPKRIGQ